MQAVFSHVAEPESPRSPEARQTELSFRREIEDWLGSGVIVAKSAAVTRVMDQVRQVAATDSTVLLLGETGTGKSLFASQIHELSARRGHPLVRVNCAMIPAALLETELFGREKRGLSGALTRQIGRFELAHNSTIFLDEIGKLPAEVQVKLLRVLEERQGDRLGSANAVRWNTRIIAATNRNLEQQVARGTFREDLFHCLNVFPIHVPPLRERVDDLPLLVWHFVDEFGKAYDKRIEAIPRETIAALQRYRWPGNVGELRNLIERAMIAAKGTQLRITVPGPPAGIANHGATLDDMAKAHVGRVLEITGLRARHGPEPSASDPALRSKRVLLGSGSIGRRQVAGFHCRRSNDPKTEERKPS
jgi:transcriptional regulator with GAF, ATPase, and Fis domain